MKRYTDTSKWDETWFFNLPPELKCAWDYIATTCDNAGVWDPNFALAETRIFGGKQGKIDWERLRASAEDRIEVLASGKWWIRKMIAFQTGVELSPKSRPHLQVIGLLRMHGILESYADVELGIWGKTALLAVTSAEGNQADLPLIGVRDRKKLAGDLLSYLNEKSGRKFSVIDKTHLMHAERALAQVGNDLPGCQRVVERAVQLWTGTKFAEFLQPSTLFGTGKFREYYDKRNDPISAAKSNGNNSSTWQQIKSLEAVIEKKKKDLPVVSDRNLYPKEYERDMEKRRPAVTELNALKQKLAKLHEESAGVSA